MILVTQFLPVGLRGLIVCGLFASLMSTVDSIFHSVSTLWSIDVYKRHLRPNASPEDVVRMGKSAIVGALSTGLLFAFLVVYLKTGSLQNDPLTHWFNELSYYAKNGFVVLVSAAVFLIRPSRRLVLGAVFASMAMYFGFTLVWPEMSYLVRSGWAIVLSFTAVAVPTMRRNGWRIPLRDLIAAPDRGVARFGAGLFASLVLTHILLH